MLVDTIDVIFKAGNGGNGIVSFKKIGRGPDGGNGGRGGDLYIQGSSDLTLLNQFLQDNKRLAEDGQDGQYANRTGHKGQDLTVTLPIGTEIIDKTTNKRLLTVLSKDEKILFLTGGRGGHGNFEFRSSRNTTPKYAQKGQVSEELNLTLNLKLIADFGLIGLPNAGKSSLLNELTNSKAKIGNYPFTTLSPNLGVMDGKIIADIPGLIEGASTGKGLGIKFLKHIEKVKIIIHCIDITSNDIKQDYQKVRNELGKYSKRLLNKKELIVLTKSDSLNLDEFKLPAFFKNAHCLSIYDHESIEKLKAELFKN